MNGIVDQEDRVKSLEQFANAAGGGGGGGSSGDGGSRLPAPAQFSAPAERVFGAQPIAIKRDEEQILRKLRVRAAAAGEAFFYRIPVRKKVKNKETGKDEWVTDYIEGPSIKCANAVALLFGNCDTDLRVFDTGTHWIIYARFIDLETGYSLVRPFQQRKSQGSIKGDSGRQEDIAFQIGVSKAIRNVTCNALEFFTSFAAEEAKHSIIEKVGKRLDYYRERVAERLKEMEIAFVRVERVRGRAIKDWLATDVAKTIAELQAINDGMATADETYPLQEAAKETVDPDTGEVLNAFAKPAGDKADGASAAANENAQNPQPDATLPQAAANGADGAEVGDGSAPTPNASAPTTPKSDAEYKVYATAWIAEQTSHEECNARWAREKKMRKDVGITQETFDELEALKKAKVVALKDKG